MLNLCCKILLTVSSPITKKLKVSERSPTRSRISKIKIHSMQNVQLNIIEKYMLIECGKCGFRSNQKFIFLILKLK